MPSYFSAIRLCSVFFLFASVPTISSMHFSSRKLILIPYWWRCCSNAYGCILFSPCSVLFFDVGDSDKTFPSPITILPLQFKLFINSKMYCELGRRTQNDKYSARLIYALDAIRELKTFPMRTATSCGFACCLRWLRRPPLTRSIPTRLKN